MPRVRTTPTFLQRLAALEDQVARLQRAGWERDEVPVYPTSLHGIVFEDFTGSFGTLWETIISPRAATLSVGLVFFGDQVSGTNTGGEWRLQLNDSIVAASGNVPATFSFIFATASIDLTPYRADSQLKVQLQVRRTSGATSGGMYGGGGSIGGAFRYARLL